MAQRMLSPNFQRSEIFMDEDSASEEEVESDGDEYQPSGASESDEEGSESGAGLFVLDQPSTSTRVGVNTRGSSRRGRGARNRGRITAGRIRAERRAQTDILWTEDDDTVPDTPAFKGTPGIKVDLQPDASPLDYFQQFVNQDLLTEMVQQTNLYVEQYKASHGDSMKPHSLLANWTPVTLDELTAFLGLLFLMGIIDKPDIKSYWSTNPLLETPIYGKTMSRHRFETILMAFHLADNSKSLPRDHPDYDKLFKIRPILEHLQNQFQAVYKPDQNLSIDESMLPWRGRVSFRQFIPSKPIRYGIKLYLCCESQSSYICKMEVYSGRKGQKREKDHGPNVVKRLAEDFKQQGYTIYIDSFFSSVQLFEELRKDGITATGTIRKDRIGLPTQMNERNIKKGETVEYKKDIEPNPQDANDTSASLHALKFHDKKIVTLLSTCSTGTPVNTGKKDKNGAAVMLPDMVHTYNNRMNGVDKFDQLLQYYSFNRKTWKWWKRACFHLLHMAKVQACIVFNLNNPNNKMSQLDFTLKLIELMLTGAPSAKAFKRPVASPSARLTEKHFPSKIPATEKKQRPQRVCVVCSVRNENGKGYKVRRESRFECRECDKGLHVGECFETYHTKVAYKKPRTDAGDGGDNA